MKKLLLALALAAPAAAQTTFTGPVLVTSGSWSYDYTEHMGQPTAALMCIEGGDVSIPNDEPRVVELIRTTGRLVDPPTGTYPSPTDPEGLGAVLIGHRFDITSNVSLSTNDRGAMTRAVQAYTLLEGGGSTRALVGTAHAGPLSTGFLSAGAFEVYAGPYTWLARGLQVQSKGEGANVELLTLSGAVKRGLAFYDLQPTAEAITFGSGPAGTMGWNTGPRDTVVANTRTRSSALPDYREERVYDFGVKTTERAVSDDVVLFGNYGETVALLPQYSQIEMVMLEVLEEITGCSDYNTGDYYVSTGTPVVNRFRAAGNGSAVFQVGQKLMGYRAWKINASVQEFQGGVRITCAPGSGSFTAGKVRVIVLLKDFGFPT